MTRKTLQKFILTVIVLAVLIGTMAVGVGSLLAEPTIYDLVPQNDFGEFVPNRLVTDSDKMRLVGIMSSTNLMFEEAMWKDVNGDGVVDPMDIYDTPNFASEMLMITTSYPIIQIDKNDNFYVVLFGGTERVDGVIADLHIAYNNDNGQIIDDDLWFYDHNSGFVYIKKEFMDPLIENEEYAALSMEPIFLFKEIDEATRSIDASTLFSEDIEDTHSLIERTPNGLLNINIKQWQVEGLSYQLFPIDSLGYVKSEYLEVYLNGSNKTEDWVYDETTGIITIKCEAGNIESVVVTVSDLQEVDESTLSIQKQQVSEFGGTPQAASMSEIVRGNNLFLKLLTFEDALPQVGAKTNLDFTNFTYIRSTQDHDSSAITDSNYYWRIVPSFGSFTGAHANDNSFLTFIRTQLTNSINQSGEYFETTTVSANDWTESYRPVYGGFVNDLYISTQTGSCSDFIAKFTSFYKGLGASQREYEFSTSWNVQYSLEKNNPYKYYGKYITGCTSDNFLGGKVKSMDGGNYAYFDMSCAVITAPAWDYEVGKNEPSDLHPFRSSASIIEVDTKNNLLYVGVWSRTLGTTNAHVQRFFGFSRIPYEYAGKGYVQITKRDADVQSTILGGAQIGIYKDPACTKLVKTITTAENKGITVELDIGTYYLKEIKAPTGYVKTDDVIEVTVQGGKTTTATILNKRQTGKIHFTVYDKTTEHANVKAPVEGMTFELWSPEPNPTKIGTYVTDRNGKIPAIEVYRTGTYILKQVGTVEHYAYDRYATENKYCCMGIQIDMRPTNSGKNEDVWAEHYEQRQTVSIKSHVQDVNLGDKSPAVLGGLKFNDFVNDQQAIVETEGSYTSLIGARYQLYAVSDLFLGYTPDGRKVEVPAGTLLEFKARDADGGIANKSETYSQAIDTGVDKAYIYVDTIIYQGREYPAPNGTYKWVLKDPSPGYYLEEDSDWAETTISAPWSVLDASGNYLVHQKVEQPVTQVRQTVSLEIFSKYFEEKEGSGSEVSDVTSQYSLNSQNYTIHAAGNYKWNVGKYVTTGFNTGNFNKVETDVDIDRILISNSSSLTTDSTDTVILAAQTQDGRTNTTELRSEGVSGRTIYYIRTLTPVVDIKTGETIPANVVVGYYISTGIINGKEEEGHFIVTNFGSEAFDNPNMESQSYPMLPEYVVTTPSGAVTDAQLPNGLYRIDAFITEDGMFQEEFVTNDIAIGLSWRQETSDLANLEYSTTSMVKYDDEFEPGDGVSVAPDPDPDPDKYEDEDDYPYTPEDPYDPSDPYDPEYPDDVEEDPDDSTDIPLVPIKWVYDNKDTFSYRVADMDNITTVGGSTTIDFSDKMPTTFAFYYPSISGLNLDKYTYTYELWFYYEITEEEYENHLSECEFNSIDYCTMKDHWKNGHVVNGECQLHHDSLCGVYLKDSSSGSTKYFRRFQSSQTSGGDAATAENLTDIIALNEESDGFLDYNFLSSTNASVSGAVFNYDWLNKKLLEQEDGEYKIGIRVNLVESYVIENQQIDRRYEGYSFGTLNIKNRQLFPLD